MPFSIGEEIVGRLYREHIHLQKMVSAKPDGSTYLALWRGQTVVVKLGDNIVNISLEIQRLMTINEAQETFPGPRLLGFDDVEKAGKVYAFYLMDYQAGLPLREALQRQVQGSLNWLWIILQVLHHLEKLHQSGYVFGNWEPQQITVNTKKNSNIRFVNLDGVTRHGQEIKKRTALYDRGTWQAGSHVADEAYDLFALTLFILDEIFACSLELIKPEQRQPQTLYDIIRTNTYMPPALKKLFMQAVRGEVPSAHTYSHALFAALGEGLYVRRPQFHQLWQRRLWECCFASASVLFLSILYVVIQS